MSKSKFVFLVIFSSLFCLTDIVYASDWYLGLEGSYNYYSIGRHLKDTVSTETASVTQSGSFDTHNLGIGLYAGKMVTKDWGVEFGYHANAGDGAASTNGLRINNTDVKVKVKSYNLFVDMVGVLPVHDKVDIMGILGVGLMRTKSVIRDEPAGLDQVVIANLVRKKTKFGPRIGIGPVYQISEFTSTRLMVRYQHIAGNLVLKNNLSVALGLARHF